jgi:hypothetical protein
MRPEAPVEGRLAALEANLTSLRTELEEEAKERRDEARKLAQAGYSERQAREASPSGSCKSGLKVLGLKASTSKWSGSAG